MPRIASTWSAQLVVVSATCGLLATVTWATQRTNIINAAEIPELAVTEVVPVAMTELATVRQPPPPPAPSNQLLYVFTTGKDTYVKLSDDEPKHGKRKLVDDPDGYGGDTVAEVAPADLPAKFRGWGDKTFIVDGGCRATVKAFAVVTRMEGSPGYAGLDDEKWTASTAATAGSSQLAARLDVPAQCKGALYARDASLAPLVELETLDRPDLVDQARAALLVSAAADDAQTEWTRDDQNADTWIEHAEVTSYIRRHPSTGAIHVGMHARIQHGCGGPDVNVWGLFRVGKRGELVTVEVKKLDTLYSIERVLDVDNDGKLELFGRDWLGLSNILTTAAGEQISQLDKRFYGCPC